MGSMYIHAYEFTTQYIYNYIPLSANVKWYWSFFLRWICTFRLIEARKNDIILWNIHNILQEYVIKLTYLFTKVQNTHSKLECDE